MLFHIASCAWETAESTAEFSEMVLQASNPDSVLVAIHDSARPLVTINDVRRCLKDGVEVRICLNRNHSIVSCNHIDTRNGADTILAPKNHGSRQPCLHACMQDVALMCQFLYAGGCCSARSASEAHNKGGGQ